MIKYNIIYIFFWNYARQVECACYYRASFVNIIKATGHFIIRSDKNKRLISTFNFIRIFYTRFHKGI